MPVTTTPIPIALTGALEQKIKPPLSAGAGQPWSVTVGNYSPSILTVTMAGYTGTTIPAYSQATFTSDAGPIKFNLTGKLPAGTPGTSGSGYVVLTWRSGPEVSRAVPTTSLSPTIFSLGPGSTVKITGSISGTVSISGGTVDIGTVTGPVNLAPTTQITLNQTTPIGITDELVLLASGSATPTLLRFKVTIPHTKITMPFAALLVVVGTPATAFTMYCAAAGQGSTRLGFSAPAADVPNAALPRKQAIIPCALVQTQALTVEVWVSTATNYGYAIYGLTSNPGVPVRSDGRAYPNGNLNARGVLAGAGSATIVGAPTTPLAIYVRSLTISATTAAGAHQLVKLGSKILWTNPGQGGMIVLAPQGGIVGGPATALTITTGLAGATCVVSADYDLIPG